MIENLTFLNEKWLWPALSGGIILWLFFVGFAWFSGQKKYFFLKILAAFLAVAALFFIALKPALNKERDTATGILLTSGYDEQMLDSLEKTGENLTILKYDPDNTLSKALDSLTAVTVIGNGVKSYDFWQFKTISTRFLLGKLPEGIIKLRYEKRPTVGENLAIRGFYNLPENGHRLLLQDPGGGGLDSINLKKKDSVFELKSPLKVPGKFVYHLVEKDSVGNVITSDPLPVEVEAQQVLNILIVNDFPTFETKYLKNYLAAMGHHVLIRSQFTKGRFKYEYFNREEIPLSGLSRDALRDFDLLLIDGPSLRNLSNSTKNGLKTAINEDGLGVFVQADVDFFRSPVAWVPLKFGSDQNTRVRLDEFPQLELTKSPFVFERTFGLETVQQSGSGIISAYSRNGKGRVGTTVLEKSYELLLDGKPEIYAKLWSEMLQKLAKRKAVKTQWSIHNQVIYKDEPLNFNIYTETEVSEVFTEDQNAVALKQDFDLPQKWEGSTYPRGEGWHNLCLQNDSSAVFDYYVAGDTNWQALTAYETRRENERFFNSENTSALRKKTSKPVNLWWFYAVFLLSMGYLWLAAKLEK